VLELFPDIARDRILYTPNFAPRGDYEFGLEQGVWVTLDNLHPLRHWPELFRGREIFLRVDTGKGHGHHEHVRTAGTHSKFGIPLFELEEARKLVAACGSTVVGLHAHTGSGILTPQNWQDVGRELVAIARDFPQIAPEWNTLAASAPSTPACSNTSARNAPAAPAPPEAISGTWQTARTALSWRRS
jgi:diaminopimelate decarboxylase/aspartate kinase